MTGGISRNGSSGKRSLDAPRVGCIPAFTPTRHLATARTPSPTRIPGHLGAGETSRQPLGKVLSRDPARFYAENRATIHQGVPV